MRLLRRGHGFWPRVPSGAGVPVGPGLWLHPMDVEVGGSQAGSAVTAVGRLRSEDGLTDRLAYAQGHTPQPSQLTFLALLSKLQANYTFFQESQ